MKDLYRFLAFDLGAESGRAVLGELKAGKITLTEVHRFRTEGVIMLGRRQWDLLRLYEEMIEGLSKCAREHGAELDGIGIDTWGVDFGLLSEDGHPVANPVHYRDSRTDGMFERAFARVPREEIYGATGIQFLPFIPVTRFSAWVEEHSPQLQAADSLLLMGDLLGYLLSRVKACEYRNPLRSQLVQPEAAQVGTTT